jgi:hypothetical protein
MSAVRDPGSRRVSAMLARRLAVTAPSGALACIVSRWELPKGRAPVRRRCSRQGGDMEKTDPVELAASAADTMEA